MRIRHILPQTAMGTLPLDPLSTAATGVVTAAWNLAVQQAMVGHEVEMVSPSDSRRMNRQSVAGVKIYRLPQWQTLRTSRYDFSYLIPLLLFTLRSNAVDVTHVHSNPYLVIRPRSRATVLHFQNSPVKSSSKYDGAVARADAVICCSRFIQQQVIDSAHYPASQTHVVYNGANYTLFSQSDRVHARVTYGILDNQIVLLYVGRIGPEKGLLVLIDAIEQIVKQSDLKPLLLVAGSGTLGFEMHRAAWPELQAYEELIRQRAFALPVRFLGDVSRPDLPDLYRATDIFICPSIYQEPFGMVAVEAAAAGLPVIASAVGGLPEAVTHEQTGYLVPPNNGEALAHAILRLIGDSSLRHRLGSAGQQRAAQFDWAMLTSEVIAIYTEVLDQNDRQRHSSKCEDIVRNWWQSIRKYRTARKSVR